MKHTITSVCPTPATEIFAGLDQTDIVGFGGCFPMVDNFGQLLQQTSAYIPAFPIYPPEFSWIREFKPELGTSFAGVLKTGSRIVYLAADLDRCYGKEGLSDHARILVNAVHYAADHGLPLTVSGEGKLDCTIYQQGKRVIVHLVNTRWLQPQSGLPGQILPGRPKSKFPCRIWLRYSKRPN